MITFFKIIDPLRALALFGILLALALLQWTVFPLGQLQVELGWELLGKRILDGQTLYVGVVDDTAPLSALVFTLLQWLFPAQVWPHRLIALLLIFAQANYLNSLLVRYGAFELTTYVPALSAIFIYAFNAEFLLLSPMLMGSFFLLLALGQLFSQTVLQEESLSSTTLLGVYAGMAACFHLPFLVFLPFFLIAGITISGFTFNQVLLTLVNFFLPLGFLALYYFWIDALPSFYHEFLLGTRIKDVYNHLSLLQALVVLAVPLFFAILGFTIGSVKRGYTSKSAKTKTTHAALSIFRCGHDSAV
ncbi:hypothetical protein A3SI_15196 [Nitritalea halalkaliphila LW7]|uniref:Uncharacterized protein n=1 Tax=Nitritalea halalkaliphila LW7 TaxID=1189621 RepID=I5BYY4_9BACT|nr:hypothetical protein [Nitritalea halalkaliphila]EIM74786.1 hypothetical protein A3SI_15196 [Nitritalea halalkaliphila LW7]